jgi:hypothetical protein
MIVLEECTTPIQLHISAQQRRVDKTHQADHRKYQRAWLWMDMEKQVIHQTIWQLSHQYQVLIDSTVHRKHAMSMRNSK